MFCQSFASLVPSPFIKRSGYEANLLHTLTLEDQLLCIILNTNQRTRLGNEAKQNSQQLAHVD